MNSKFTIAVLASLVAISVSQANADSWSAARGGPQRTGLISGRALLDEPQQAWAMHLGGDLAANSVWALDSDEPAIIIAVGGRIFAKAWDDVVVWKTELLQANQIIAVIDADQNGDKDTIVANRNGVAGTLTLLNMDGTVRWIAPVEIGPLNNGIRIEDLDGDGDLDLLATPYKSGAGITAYSLAPVSDEPSVLWHASRDNRDYKAGFFDLIGEFDGSPGLEFISAGHRYLYLHDAATGVLQQTSAELGFVPYSRATMTSVDVDGDGTEEVFAFSNQDWLADRNRRHVSSYSWKEGTFIERWSFTLAEEDRLRFTAQSVGDFDSDGQYEVAYSIFSGNTETWSLEIRDAATGVILTQKPGLRLSTLVGIGGEQYIATQDDGGPLELFQFIRGQELDKKYETSGFEIALCRKQEQTIRSSANSSPCTMSSGDVLLFSRDQDDRRTGIALLHSLSSQPSVFYTPDNGTIVGYWIPPGTGNAAVAIALSTGKLQPLSVDLVVPDPIIAVPYSWSGVFFGSTIQRTNFARFPLSYPSQSTNEADNLLVIGGDNEAMAIAPSTGATVTGGAQTLWTHPGADRMSLAMGEDDHNVLLFNEQDGVTALSVSDGQVRWTTPSLFARSEGLRLHHAPIQVGLETWFHRLRSGAYELFSISNADGSLRINTTLDQNSSGWRRLTAVENGSGSQVISSGPIRELWTYDENGAPSAQYDSRAASMIIDIEGGWLQISSVSFEKIAYDGTVSWYNAINNAKTRLGAVLSVSGIQHYGTILGNTNEMTLIATDTGETTWSTLLSNGAVVADQTENKVILGNITAVEELSPSVGPALIVGGSDGFLYAVAANNGELVWSLDLGAPVGEIISSDWDGDGYLELSVVTADGKVRGIDTFSVPAPSFCIDVDPENIDSIVDIDRVVSESALAGSWSPVEGATAYELAVFTMTGTLVRDFEDVGTETKALISGLPLVSDTRYRLAVRAVFANSQHSADVASDGVTVLFEEEEEEEEEPIGPTQPAGCGCQAKSDNNSGASTLVFLFFALLVIRRSRRSKMGS